MQYELARIQPPMELEDRYRFSLEGRDQGFVVTVKAVVWVYQVGGRYVVRNDELTKTA